MDYEQDLLDDLGSSPESEIEETNETHQENNGANSASFEEKLAHILDSSETRIDTVLNDHTGVSAQELYGLSKVYQLIPELEARIERFSSEEESDYSDLMSFVNEDNQSEEYRFILAVNEISTLINQDIESFHSLLKILYKPVFSELESLVPNPVDYARTVYIIRQDLANIKDHEEDLKKLLSNEKVLVIIMGAVYQSQSSQADASSSLEAFEMDKVLTSCKILMELDDILAKLSRFITQKLAKIAPNVSAIIGPITTSQLLIATGSLRQLSLTPACNLASLGVRDLSSNARAANSRTIIRQPGYLYHSDLVKYLPGDITRSVMRIVSGKIILAARIDLSKSRPDGEQGQKWAEEIQNKIEKLLTPPEQSADKALPVPVDQKSKKRGGRRFRKMKERTQMSEIRKAQNKMEFGKEESTFVDAFGEEVGLGMSRSSGIGQIKVNTNTSARMSKAMISRLQKQQQEQTRVDDFESILLAAPKQAEPSARAESATNNPKHRWFTGMRKRRIEEDLPEAKRQKGEE